MQPFQLLLEGEPEAGSRARRTARVKRREWCTLGLLEPRKSDISKTRFLAYFSVSRGPLKEKSD